MARKVIVIGGVAGGASAATRLRRLDETAEIILIEKGKYISYANCGLPYYIGGVIENRGDLLVMTPELMHYRFNIDVRTQHEVLTVNTENKTVEILNHITGETYQEDFSQMILSPGSEPLKPPIPGIQEEGIFTLWTIPDTDRIYDYIAEANPKRAIVVGGGFIGLEMAENLYEKGIKVSIVEMLDQVMAPVDFDMAQILHEHMRELGVELHLSSKVESFSKTADGLQVKLADGQILTTDMILLSLGVRPQTGFLRDSGLDFGPRGHLIVDEYLETNIPGIYAVGDAIEVKHLTTGQATAIPLAGPANKQGRMAADNLVSGKKHTYNGSQGTSIAKVFEYNVAGVGLNEKNLIAMGQVYQQDYDIAMINAKNHASYYPGVTEMYIKAVFSLPEGKLLGCQIVGDVGVDKRIDVFATVQRLGGTVTDLKELELAYAPPFNSAKDPMNMIGFVAENIIEGLVEFITPMHLVQEKSEYTFLDLREEAELMMGSIDGAIHIPLGELRQRMNELDREKSYVILCSLGVRSYLGARIMKQHGFRNVRVLSAGLPAWNSFHQDKNIITPRATATIGTAEAKFDVHGEPDMKLNVAGAQCPGPILQVAQALENLKDGQILEVISTDQGFYRDMPMWCSRTGNTLLCIDKEEKTIVAKLRKGSNQPVSQQLTEIPNNKTMVVFSGDLDKAIAALIIANGAASMGRQVTMFYTFWGLNILRRHDKISLKKPFIQKAFASMMPRGTKKLGLSRMNFMGAGAKLIRKIMKDNRVDSLESLMEQALAGGVKMIACNMSMDLMGIREEELIDGIELGGVAAYLGEAEMADTNLFI